MNDVGQVYQRTKVDLMICFKDGVSEELQETMIKFLEIQIRGIDAAWNFLDGKYNDDRKKHTNTRPNY